jgi:WD40-like Beta Propeller Repeat
MATDRSLVVAMTPPDPAAPAADPDRRFSMSRSVTLKTPTPPLPAIVFSLLLVSGCMAGAAGTPGVGTGAAPSMTTTPAQPTELEAPSASPDAIVLDGKLLYDRTTAGDVHAIYLLENGLEKALTKPGAYQGGGLSPDSKSLLVLPGGELEPPLAGGVLGIDGTGYRAIPSHDETLNLIPCCWSPDMSRILFLGFDESDPSRSAIYSGAPDGTHLVPIISRPGRLADAPMGYSPDGTMILFYRSAHPDPDPHTDGSLWVARADGKDAHEISGTAHPADFASWSPDGKLIVFANERLSPSGAVWTVRPDGSELTQVFEGAATSFPVSPTWSPDGARILFAMGADNDEFEHHPNFFVVMPADGSADPVRVSGTADGSFSRWPTWFE